MVLCVVLCSVLVTVDLAQLLQQIIVELAPNHPELHMCNFYVLELHIMCDLGHLAKCQFQKITHENDRNEEK
jgi:hypothetical protein